MLDKVSWKIDWSRTRRPSSCRYGLNPWPEGAYTAFEWQDTEAVGGGGDECSDGQDEYGRLSKWKKTAFVKTGKGCLYHAEAQLEGKRGWIRVLSARISG